MITAAKFSASRVRPAGARNRHHRQVVYQRLCVRPGQRDLGERATSGVRDGAQRLQQFDVLGRVVTGEPWERPPISPS